MDLNKLKDKETTISEITQSRRSFRVSMVVAIVFLALGFGGRYFYEQYRSGAPVSQSRRIWFEIIDTVSLESRSVAVGVPDEGAAQWRVGPLHSGAALEIAEPLLEGLELFVVGASNHLMLKGRVADRASLPSFGVGERAVTGEWNWRDPMQWEGALRTNELYIRFDYQWLRIGRHALRASWKPIAGGGLPTNVPSR